jgi:hypothetical protein
MSEKYFSRKGAKAQRRNGVSLFFFASFFASLRLCVSIFLLLLAVTPAFTQRKQSTARFDPDGSFWIHGNPPNDFSDFGGINLNAKRLRRLPSPGVQSNNGSTYRFKTLTVKRDNFTFTTVTVRGVSYSFAGKFLKGGVYAAGDLDDETPVLEGTLTKFRDGKKVAEANLKFVYFGGT